MTGRHSTAPRRGVGATYLSFHLFVQKERYIKKRSSVSQLSIQSLAVLRDQKLTSCQTISETRRRHELEVMIAGAQNNQRRELLRLRTSADLEGGGSRSCPR